ncbi:MAG: hypothetical protein IKO83_11825 [Oscillospiraceae bacterium]|nr:hypothetical protein [Oscillospiraceae bacterium]
MALSRKFLAALGIEESKIESIIDAHTETVDALKKERDGYKAEADKIPDLQKDLEKAKAAAKDSGEFDKLKKEYEDFKAEVANKETLANKKAALKKLCEAKEGAYLSETGVAKALKYSDYSKIELDEKGEIKDAKELAKSLREEWKEHAQSDFQNGVRTPTPPVGGSGSGGGETSRAAQLYAQHRAALYGQTDSKGESK